MLNLFRNPIAPIAVEILFCIMTSLNNFDKGDAKKIVAESGIKLLKFLVHIGGSLGFVG